ncbi:hypothetical protein KW797_00125 [Candidatus Parcubacteria bacterium]|nr:hypothetical protein [Candidatus Parcubacteria bacterium]
MPTPSNGLKWLRQEDVDTADELLPVLVDELVLSAVRTVSLGIRMELQGLGDLSLLEEVVEEALNRYEREVTRTLRHFRTETAANEFTQRVRILVVCLFSPRNYLAPTLEARS